MEKNTKEYNEKLERIFKELNYSFEQIDLEDDDINYIISFSTSGSNFPSIKALNRIQDVFVYISAYDDSLNVLAVNVYQMNEKEDINQFYKLVNNVNNVIDHGKFSVYEETRSITYRAVIDYNEECDIISKKVINNIINDYLENISIFYLCKKRMMDKNGK